MTHTIVEAGGDVDANDPQLRRVDLVIDTIRPMTETGGHSEAETLSPVTRRWSINVDVLEIDATWGGPGVAAFMGRGSLANRDTGQKVRGKFWAAGGAAAFNLPLPSVSPGDWTDFVTTHHNSFAPFDGSTVHLVSAAGGAGPLGYGIVRFQFWDLMSEPVMLHGVSYMQSGVGASIAAGTWEFTEPIPDPITRGRERAIRYETTAGTQFGHRTLFATGEDGLSNSELDALGAFVAGVR